MRALSIPKVVVMVVGVVVLILGILAGISLVITLILSGGFFLYANTFARASQQWVIMYASACIACFSIIGGLIFLMPVKMGRRFRAARYTTPDMEVVPKAYRTGGVYMLVAGVVAAVMNFLFAPIYILDVALPIVLIIGGIIGLLAGSAHGG